MTDVSCLPKLTRVRLDEMAALGQPCNPGVLSFVCLDQFFFKVAFILHDKRDKSVMSVGHGLYCDCRDKLTNSR